MFLLMFPFICVLSFLGFVIPMSKVCVHCQFAMPVCHKLTFVVCVSSILFMFYFDLILLSGDIEVNPGPTTTKTCPKCFLLVHIRKLACNCGHIFRKPKSACVSTASRINKTSCGPSLLDIQEQQSMEKRQKDKDRIATKRALQTPEEREEYRKRDRLAKTLKKNSETEEQVLTRKISNLASQKKRLALQTEEQVLTRKISNLASQKKRLALETEEQVLTRKISNLASQKKRLALETEEQVLTRKISNLASQKKRLALETEEQVLQRKKNNLSSQNKRKVNESEGASLDRKKRNAESASKRRKLQTNEETSLRKQKDRACKARRRLFETDYEKEIRHHKDKERQEQRRLTSTVDKAIANFLKKIKVGAEFVCICCHRMLYRSSVVPYNRRKYSNCSEDLLDRAFCSPYLSNDGNEWVCTTCDNALKRSELPVQSVGNGLKLDEIPPELSNLNSLEIRLICLRIPFIKMVNLPVGKQRGIHGPTVNVPANIDNICTALPRLPSKSDIIPIKLKRKLTYKSHYLFDFVDPQKVIQALTYLKCNNPLYRNIDINYDWITEAMHDNEEVLFHLIQNPPVSNNATTEYDVSSPLLNIENVTCSNSTQNNYEELPPPPLACNTSSLNNSNNEELPPPSVACNTPSCNNEQLPPLSVTCNAPSHNNDAYSTLIVAAKERGYTVHNVPGNGSCLFEAISYQLQECPKNTQVFRKKLVAYLRENAERYKDFVCAAVPSSNAYNADTECPDELDTYIASITDTEQSQHLLWERYLDNLCNGAWADNLAIQGISDMFKIIINVLQVKPNNRVSLTTVEPCDSTCSNSTIHIGLLLQYHFVGLDPIPLSRV